MSGPSLEPGQMVEVLGHPPRVASVLHDGRWRIKIESRWVWVEPVWRPAIYADRLYPGVHLFLWTDNHHYARVHEEALGTHVRSPRGGTVSQENRIRERGELC